MHFFEKKHRVDILFTSQKKGTLVTPGAFPPAVVDLQTLVGTEENIPPDWKNIIFPATFKTGKTLKPPKSNINSYPK